MFDISKEKIVKRGKCFYGNTAEYEVIIIASELLAGSGDYADAPEIADDKEVICYYAWFDSPSSRGVFRAGSSGFLTIEESVKDVEKVVVVIW